ncbi:hypothetical protein QCA50_019274 [Cerrena zonata]|uniref:Yeast cell wall synthesis Kre9/Knh1-like N-terminal domain-containing protein n=1 Tax=Cerrena zonata TaxID=2478898 RepID=A0AAW0FCJ8_9APHY
MMMKFTPAALFVLFVTLLSTLVSALPILESRDVFVPPITSPDALTIWSVGSKQNVTWDTSNPPAQITNGNGTIYLAKGGLIQLDTPLADKFSILNGIQEVTVPDVEPGVDYAVVLFGDSGNFSPEFSIV